MEKLVVSSLHVGAGPVHPRVFLTLVRRWQPAQSGQRKMSSIRTKQERRIVILSRPCDGFLRKSNFLAREVTQKLLRALGKLKLAAEPKTAEISTFHVSKQIRGKKEENIFITANKKNKHQTGEWCLRCEPGARG